MRASSRSGAAEPPGTDARRTNPWSVVTFLFDAPSHGGRIFERLRLEAVLSPGQTLLLTSTVDTKGLGDQFFSASAGGGGARKLRLVRLAQTQYDDLFASEDAALPAMAPSP